MMGFATNEELMSSISDVRFCWLNLLVQGHMTVICAKGNGGKTTVMINAAADMAKAGYEVYYINVDASADQLKEYDLHARANGYTLIAPDIHVGKSVNDVIDLITDISKTGEELSGVVLVLDTLKKFTELINKNVNKEFYSMLRKLTAKGATLVTLAHTNKYDDKDGKPVFEGTGDLRNDFDELIYFIPVQNPDGSMLVSTNIDKRRAIGLQDVTFEISPERVVTIKDHFIDTITLEKYREGISRDSDVINFILDSIKLESKSIDEIQREAKGVFGRDKIRHVTYEYSSGNEKCPDPLWLSIKSSKFGYRYGSITEEYRQEVRKSRGVSKLVSSVS